MKIMVPDVSREMRAAVESAAREQGISRQHVAVVALSERYQLAVEVEAGPHTPAPAFVESSGSWSLEVPERVRRKLRLEAARRGATISGLVRETLAEKFGLPPESPSRRPRSSR